MIASIRAVRRAAILGAWLMVAPGCSGGDQSPLDPAGPQAERIVRLLGFNLAIAGAIYAAVMTCLVAGLIRRGRRQKTPLMLSPPEAQERKLNRLVVGSVAGTAAILLALVGGDYATGRAIHGLADPDALTIRVTGHQWWWEVEYQDPVPSRMVTTANEIHIPVGRTVQFDLRSADVIHSFWVPNLHGKRDMIPGDPSRLFLRADRPGTFWGQCAEFCGHEHAFMKLAVVAEPEEQFQHWMDGRRRPAPEPSGASETRGREVFLGGTCVMCHTVRGTTALSRVGPDLTHIAGRPMIGGVLPRARGHLAGWILDPQRIKPGVRMPPNPIKPEDLDHLLDYLEALK